MVDVGLDKLRNEYSNETVYGSSPAFDASSKGLAYYVNQDQAGKQGVTMQMIQIFGRESRWMDRGHLFLSMLERMKSIRNAIKRALYEVTVRDFDLWNEMEVIGNVELMVE